MNDEAGVKGRIRTIIHSLVTFKHLYFSTPLVE